MYSIFQAIPSLNLSLIVVFDVESIYWVSFRIIKCFQKLPNFGVSWGGGFKVSRIRNKIIEHFEEQRVRFTISFPITGIIYRQDSSNSDDNNSSAHDHVDELLTKALNKLPDRLEELKQKLRDQRINRR